MKIKAVLLSAVMLFGFAAFGLPAQDSNGHNTQPTQQEKSNLRNALGHAKANYAQMKSTLGQMKDDENKVNDQALKDYMQKNDQMWQQALQQEREIGHAAHQASSKK